MYFIAHTENTGTMCSSLLTAAHKHTKRAASITLAAFFIMKKTARFRTAHEMWFFYLLMLRLEPLRIFLAFLET